MSVAQIVLELPKLQPAERRLLRRQLVELAETESDEIALCDALAAEGAALLDAMEDANG
jgi:hypothetical protein